MSVINLTLKKYATEFQPHHCISYYVTEKDRMAQFSVLFF